MWHVTEGASAPLPPFLAAIASSSRAVDAPVGVKELQAAQRELSELVETSIKPHTFLATSPAVDTAIPRPALWQGTATRQGLEGILNQTFEM